MIFMVLTSSTDMGTMKMLSSLSYIALTVGKVYLNLMVDGQHDCVGRDAGASCEQDASHSVGGYASLALIIVHNEGFVVAVERCAIGVEDHLHILQVH